MNVEVLSSLVAALERAGISTCSYREGSETLTLRFGHAAHPLPLASPETLSHVPLGDGAPAKLEVLSNGTGSFSRSHPLAERASEQVRQGDHIGYLTVESVLSAIVAPIDGLATAQLTEDGGTVGYGQPVLELLES